ncbi:MAG: hypothetical protein IJU86_03380, partial [Firmicutes bacterium]|nr:hypothetical protein [Bacillota bacterium]
MSAENELIKDAHFGYFKLLQEKLAEKRDISLVKTYFSHFKKNPYGCAGFKGCLEFLTEVILQQMNEKYEDNKTKYKSKEEFEEYQGGLFDVLAEMNDYLWENYLFLDRSLRWEYVDKVISKIDGDCFKRFLYTKKPKKTELETPGDREKINAYNKVLESFFYRNIRSLILSKQQCHDLFIAFHENVDKLPDWIDQYIDPSNQNDFLTTLSGDFVTLTDKIKSFDWSKKLDKNNKMARECLEDIKKVNEDVKNPGLFDFCAQFLETAIIPQINEREFKAKYYPDGKKDEEKDNQAEENYNKHQNQLLDILVETNDLIWEIINSISSSEYEKNKLLACYYNCIIKIDGYALERIGDLLNERKEKAMKSKNKNEVAEYNKLVKNFILRNLENSVMSVDRIDEMGVVNLIDEETFEEYTDDSMLKKLFDLSACFACNGSRIDNQIRLNSAIKIRKSDKNKKICLEAMFGGMMSGIHWCSTDNMLGLLKNSSDEIDFSFSSLSSKDVESSEEIKKFYLGFRSAYDDLKKNDFTVNISKLSLDDIKYFMYLGSWIVPFFP